MVRKECEEESGFDDLDDALDKFETKLEEDENVMDDIISDIDTDLDDLSGLFTRIKELTKGTIYHDQLVNIFRHMMLMANDSKLAVVGFPFLEKAVHKALVLTSEKEIDESVNLCVKDIKRLVEDSKKNPTIVELSKEAAQKIIESKPPSTTQPTTGGDQVSTSSPSTEGEINTNAPPPPPPPGIFLFLFSFFFHLLK